MSIRTVISRGFGSGASIGAVILRGYFAEADTSDTHDGADYVSDGEIKRLRRQAEKAFKAREDRRVELASKLTRAVQAAYKRAFSEPDEIAPQEAEAPVEAPRAITAPKVDWSNALDLARANELIAAIAERSRLARVQANERARIVREMEQDEEDVLILLMA